MLNTWKNFISTPKRSVIIFFSLYIFKISKWSTSQYKLQQIFSQYDKVKQHLYSVLYLHTNDRICRSSDGRLVNETIIWTLSVEAECTYKAWSNFNLQPESHLQCQKTIMCESRSYTVTLTFSKGHYREKNVYSKFSFL